MTRNENLILFLENIQKQQFYSRGTNTHHQHLSSEQWSPEVDVERKTEIYFYWD